MYLYRVQARQGVSILKINNFSIPYIIPFKAKQDIDILRFQQVDKTLHRGAQPNEEQIKKLQDMGINTIIDFRTGSDDKTKLQKEEKLANALEIKYVNLPFLAQTNPPEEHVDKFFDIIRNAKDKNEKVFIHCTAGKDRTGVFSTMYKLEFGLDTIDNTIQEMLEIGHNSEKIPNLIHYLRNRYSSNNSSLTEAESIPAEPVDPSKPNL